MKAKKAISLILALVMALGCMSVSAWATGDSCVAKIGDAEYTTLQEAFNAVTNGQTITLEKNIEDATTGVVFNHSGISATFDLNSKTFKVNTSGADNNSSNRNIKVAAGTLTVTNGTLDARNQDDNARKAYSGTYGTVRVEKGATAILDGLTMYNDNEWGLNVKNYGTVTMRSCTVNSTTGGGIENAGGTATITDCTFTQTGANSTYPYLACAISVSGLGVATINNSTFSSEAQYALYVFNSGGRLNINGGSFTGVSGTVIQVDAVTQDTYSEEMCGSKYANLTPDQKSAVDSALSTFANANGGKYSLVSVTGGNFTGGFIVNSASTAGLTITGGTFDHDPKAYVDTTSYDVTPNSPDAGLYTVTEKQVEPAPAGDWTGTGTENDPWIIANEAELRLLAERVNGAESATYKSAYYQLDADIALTDSFTPIGSGYYDSADTPKLTEPAFSGTFDGNNHTISNLTVSTTGKHAAGLFGIVNGGTIKNLTVSGATVTSAKRYAGAIVGGLTAGTIDNCHVTGIIAIRGEHFVGGLAGLSYGTIMNSSVNATGTITGVDGDSLIDDGDDVGGLVGFVQGSSGKVENGDVTAASGGLTIRGVRQVGGIAGAIDSSASIDSNSVATGVTVKSTATTDKTNADKDTNTIGLVVGRITKNATNSGTATGSTLEIATKGQLATFRDAVNAGNTFAGVTVKLTGNIDLSDTVWTPIGYSYRTTAASAYKTNKTLAGDPCFAGTFDGQNHTISGLTNVNYTPAAASVNTSSEYTYGLFGVVGDGAEIRNLTLKDVDIDTTRVQGLKGDSVGALAGYAFGTVTIDRITVENATIVGTDGVGAIIGRAYQGKYSDITKTVTLTNCSATATVSGTNLQIGSKVSGLFGYVTANSDGNFPIKVVMTGNSFRGTVSNGDYTSPIAVLGRLAFTQNLEPANSGNISGNTVDGTPAEMQLSGTVNYSNRSHTAEMVLLTKAKVAQVGQTKFETLAEAIAAAQSGDTVTLLANCETDATTTVAEGKTVTLDFNGYVLTKNNTGYALENNGTMTLIDSSTGGTGGITSYDGSVENNGTMTIGTGTFDESTKTTSDTQFGGKFTMTGNVRRSKDVYNTENGVMYVYACTVDSSVFGFYNSGTATVYGGTYVGHSDSTVTKATDNESLYAYTMTSDGTMTVYGAIVTGIHGALGINKGETTVYGGTFKAVKNNTKTSDQASGTYYALYIAGERGTTQGIIYGGTFESEGNSRVIYIGNDSDGGLKLPASAQIRGGTFTKSNVVGVGILYAASNTGNPTIYGGTFVGFTEAQATAFETYVDNNGYMALGYELKAGNENNTRTVGKKTVPTLAVTQKASSSAEGAESNLSTGDAVVITAATETTPKTATITPVDVSAVTEENAGKVTEINQDTLTEYAVANEIEKVEIVTGLSATQSVGGNAAPQTIIKDNAGKTIFEAVAKGGQIRLDKKITDGIVSNSVVDTNATKAQKAAAINYVDMRLQFEFQLPDGVSPSDPTTTWSWSVSYQDGGVTKTGKVDGVNYLPVNGTENRYTSNVVFTNVPMSLVKSNFQATLTISYVKDDVTYTITQSAEAPLARQVQALIDYYCDYYKDNSATAQYFTKLKSRISTLNQNP